MPAQRITKRVLLLGWDAADWKLIDPLLARGELPALAKFIESGVRGNLATLTPTLSPVLWTSIATGKTADKHGILGFVEPTPTGDGLRLSSSTSRKTKAIWNILSQCGFRSQVINWYASHPAEPVLGLCVSNLFQENAGAARQGWPIPAGSVHPAELADRVADLRLHPSEVVAGDLGLFVPALDQASPQDERIATLAKLVAQCASVHNVATSLLASEQWDFAAVFYETIDTIGHHFMQFHPPRMAHVGEQDFERFQHVMNGVYRFHDMMLDTLMQVVGDDTTVIIVSDHGFHSDHLRPAGTGHTAHETADAAWHRPLGMIAMHGPGIRRAGHVFGANIIDVCPTVLGLLGTPVGGDMDGRVLVEAFEHAPQIERVFSWDDVPGESGMHAADLRVDPFEARDAMIQLADLGYIQPLSGDIQRDIKVIADDAKFNLATVYATTRRPALALPIYEELHRASPNDAKVGAALAQCYADLHRYDDVAAVLKGLIESGRGGNDSHILIAATQIAQSKLGEAMETLEGASRKLPMDPVLACLLGDVRVALKQPMEAEGSFRHAAALDPDSARAQCGIGIALLAQEKFEAAAEQFLRAVELLHFYPDAHYYLGVALTWMRDYDHAIKSFEVALSMQPGYLDAHRYLASIYRERQDRDNAARHRDIAERLVRDRKLNQTSVEHLIREAPMGPQEWARRDEVREGSS